MSRYFDVQKSEKKKRREKPKPGEVEGFCLECQQADCDGWCEEIYKAFGIRDFG